MIRNKKRLKQRSPNCSCEDIVSCKTDGTGGFAHKMRLFRDGNPENETGPA